MKITCKPMDLNSVAEVAKIEALCFSSPWPVDSFLNILNNNNALYLVALENENVAGYIGIFDLIDEFSIINIATHPSYRNKGVAKYLMEQIHSRAKSKNCPLVTLEVRESNIAARSLYESFNYKEYGRLKNYYSDPLEDAILYQLRIINQEI
ncbi:MAG: ribosomal protein S18-alanine N-acetyltransferase [Clostridia bacterium]|nr:ribosomal protein S18-alanine N-acetyltransferase [Clostridia bacterium]